MYTLVYAGVVCTGIYVGYAYRGAWAGYWCLLQGGIRDGYRGIPRGREGECMYVYVCCY